MRKRRERKEEKGTEEREDEWRAGVEWEKAMDEEEGGKGKKL